MQAEISVIACRVCSLPIADRGRGTRACVGHSGIRITADLAVDLRGEAAHHVLRNALSDGANNAPSFPPE